MLLQPVGLMEHDTACCATTNGGAEYEPVLEDRKRTITVSAPTEDDPDATSEAEENYTHDTGEWRVVRAAGNRWGIRADQCLFLEAAYQRRRADRIEARLTAIEAKL